MNDRNVYGIHTYRRVGHAKAVTDPDPNTTGSNEAYTNKYTWVFGQNFIPIVYKNRSACVYPYSETYVWGYILQSQVW